MEYKKYCIFACGGHGVRMGSDLPKQFLKIHGKTILQHTMERIAEAVPHVKAITVLPEDHISYWAEECRNMRFEMPQTVVKGGITRFHSVKNALSSIPDDAIVAVHDGVRPFVSAALVSRLFETAEEYKAVVPVYPIFDTLKVLDGDLREKEGRWADRSELYSVQTPQVFRSDVLKAAYELPYDTKFTDDASVVRSMGIDVKYVLGDKYNIKITTQEDLLLSFL